MQVGALLIKAHAHPTLAAPSINGSLFLAGAAAVLLSVKIVSVKLLYRQGLDPVTVLALRMLVAAPFFFAAAAWTWRRAPRPSARDLLHLSGLGLMGFYLSSMLDFMGLTYISAGLERVILFLTPTVVLLLGTLMLGRRVTGRQCLSMAIAYSGILLVFWHEVRFEGGARATLGASLVAMSAISYAVYLVLAERLIHRLGMLRVVSLAMSVSCIACVLQYAVLRPPLSLFEHGPQVWWLSLLNGTLGTAVPVFMTMIAVRNIGSGLAAQAGMIGPMATLFIAWWLLDEPITTLQLLGAATVTMGLSLLYQIARPGPPPAAP